MVRGGLALLRACHPEPSATVTAIAVALSAVAGRDAPGLLAVGAAVLSGQLSVGWLNDYADADRDASAGRTDKPIAAGAVSRRAVGVAVVVAAVLCVPLSLLSGPAAGAVHLLAVGSAWAYNLGLKSTAVSVAPYALSFGLLPVFVGLGLPGGQLPPGWLVAAAVLLGSGAHFVNALPDLADDAATAVRGLPHRLGRTGSQVAASALVLAASVVLAFGLPDPVARVVALVVPPATLAVGQLLGRRQGSRAAFRAVLVVALVDVLLLVASGARLR